MKLIISYVFQPQFLIVKSVRIILVQLVKAVKALILVFQLHFVMKIVTLVLIKINALIQRINNVKPEVLQIY